MRPYEEQKPVKGTPVPCDMWAGVGSFHMGLPNPVDRDFIVFGPVHKIKAWAELNDWIPSNEDYEGQTFLSYRKGNRNLIVIFKEAEFNGFLAAFHLCRKYKVTDKAHRALIHEACRLRNYTPTKTVLNEKTKEICICDCWNRDSDAKSRPDSSLMFPT